jgi:hypothetical protein
MQMNVRKKHTGILFQNLSFPFIEKSNAFLCIGNEMRACPVRTGF